MRVLAHWRSAVRRFGAARLLATFSSPLSLPYQERVQRVVPRRRWAPNNSRFDPNVVLTRLKAEQAKQRAKTELLNSPHFCRENGVS
jgi:hypothetical protein